MAAVELRAPRPSCRVAARHSIAGRDAALWRLIPNWWPRRGHSSSKRSTISAPLKHWRPLLRRWLTRPSSTANRPAEKAIKGFPAWHGRSFRKTHNLEEVGEQCLAIDPTLRAAIDRAVPLSEYAWKFRYPGEPSRPGPDEVAEAFAAAREVFEAAVNRLPLDPRP